MSTTKVRESLHGKLPLTMPRPCPICGAKVYLTEVNEWGADDGEIIGVSFECETEPDIDSDEWPEWHANHYAMPYVDWLPYEQSGLSWLNRHYHYLDEGPDVTTACHC
jgi:hypothetical protein